MPAGSNAMADRVSGGGKGGGSSGGNKGGGSSGGGRSGKDTSKTETYRDGEGNLRTSEDDKIVHGAGSGLADKRARDLTPCEP